jgi:ribonuclease P protein component
MDNMAGHPRMGLIVPRFQSTAVARNRLRRRLTEVWRRDVRARQGGRDLLIRVRREAYGATFEELREAMLNLSLLAFGDSDAGHRA